MATLQEIDKLAERFSRVNAQLIDAKKMIDDEIGALVKRHGAPLRRLVNMATEAQIALHEAIDESPELFAKPRKTQILHGWRVGLRKEADGVEFGDGDKVVELIERHLPDLADVLIRVEKKPIVKAIEQLDREQLRTIGCRWVEGKDGVTILPAASDVDKLLAAMVRKAVEEAQA